MNRTREYPQLFLIFPTFAHNTNTPLAEVYSGLINLLNVITTNVPATSSVILYSAPPNHAKKFLEKSLKWRTSEGAGYNPNDKMQAMNYFLSKLLLSHYESGKSPPIYSFFDLYHMQEQQVEAWDRDNVHSLPHWYKYVVGYTAAMLPSVPPT